MTNRRLPLFFSLLLCGLLSQLCIAAGDPFKSADRNTDLVAHDEFLPVDQAYKPSVDFQNGKLAVHWQIAEGYYLYRHQFAFTADSQPLNAAIPAGKAKEDEFFGHVEVYYHNIDVILESLPAQPFTLAITSQGCADAGLCYPPTTRYFRIDPATQATATTTAPTPAANSANPNPAQNNADTSIAAWLTILLLAALGGATLNLMPCVFPILSLKVLSFANHRNQHQALHGVSYMAGVIGSFLLVAGVLLGLKAAGRAVGWGFQLQEPWFVGALAYLFFAMGLSLSGFWALGGSWMGLGGKLTEQPGYSGSFFTGVLATLVASPCTAPFMSSALGFAVTQPALPALSVFAALGFGMALPVLLLCLNPKLLARIPKPGIWMERFKQVLAFPLYATAIWLCWIVGRQTGASGMALILGGALLLTLGLWLWQFGIFSRVVAALSFALAVASLSSSLLLATPDASSGVASETQPYSATTLASLRAAGKPVFLNVTADWCITCLTNEKVALSSRAVKEAFNRQGITYLKGDWTHYDPALTALLAQFGRSGIPLYVFFPADTHAEPIVLPQLLTPSTVVEALTSANASVAATGF